jgi:hypothetical protein
MENIERSPEGKWLDRLEQDSEKLSDTQDMN